jgi:hypothetical protein
MANLIDLVLSIPHIHPALTSSIVVSPSASASLFRAWPSKSFKNMAFPGQWLIIKTRAKVKLAAPWRERHLGVAVAREIQSVEKARASLSDPVTLIDSE